MAKTLYLVRHAKSSWTDISHTDFDRPLNNRGLRNAAEMGRRMHRRSVQPDIVLCSPAQRARQTAELLLSELKSVPKRLQFEPCIYEASPEILLNLLAGQPQSCSTTMLIGHNPAMGWLAVQLSDQYVEHMPTCGIATIELETDDWRTIGTCASQLLDFDFPKRLHDNL